VLKRRHRRDQWLHVFFEWTAFRDMNVPPSKSRDSVGLQTEPEDARFDTGTIIQIEELTLNWAGAFPAAKRWALG